MALYRYCVGKWCCSCCGLCPQKPKNLTLEKIPGVYYINHAALGDISNGSSPQAPEEGFDGMVVYANPFITSNGKSGFTVTPQTAEDKKNPMFKENNPSLNGSVAHNNSSKKFSSNGFTPHRKMKNKKLQRPKSALETLNPVEMGYYVSENPSAIERDKLGNDSNDNIYSNQAAVLDITQNAQFSTVERQNRQNVHTEQNIKTMDDPDQWVPTKKKKKEKKSKKENLDDFCYSNDWAMENEISEVSKPEAANQTYI
ncbi:unnamed protein product [Owenia fusiformis]|nr:unnamed protein product [Owenia fusiformis]